MLTVYRFMRSFDKWCREALLIVRTRLKADFSKMETGVCDAGRRTAITSFPCTGRRGPSAGAYLRRYPP